MFNSSFWAPYIRARFATNTNTTIQVLQGKILPVFDAIDLEAETVANQAYERMLNSHSASDNVDTASISETAFEEGLEFHNAMSGVRQAILNAVAVIFYHQLEQQLLLFHRRQVLHPAEENDDGLFDLSSVRKRLLAGEVDITSFDSWGKVSELRLLANSIKHGDGRSVKELKRLKPNLFSHPILFPEQRLSQYIDSKQVLLPLGGEDIYVTTKDLQEYADAVTAFWDDFADAIESSE